MIGASFFALFCLPGSMFLFGRRRKKCEECHQSRYVMKYRHCDGKLVLKVTDNRKVKNLDFSLSCYLLRPFCVIELPPIFLLLVTFIIIIITSVYLTEILDKLIQI